MKNPSVVVAALALLVLLPNAAALLQTLAEPVCAGDASSPTDGAGDPALPDLAYAALKTGTRAVVAWTTPTDVAATLAYRVGDGPERVVREEVATRMHVFVLDQLPRGEMLCFVPSGGGAHAMRLANAMHAYDGEAYSINLLVLANEPVDLGALENGLDSFAWRLRDATDGHVRAGRILVAVADLGHHNSGWTSCYVPFSIIGASTPTCQRVVDVLFTADAYPAGAASTYKDGIADDDAAIWMNSYWQAGAVNLGDDVGSVLMHEMGHYAFGADDLYGNGECDDLAKGISVMGGSRKATEFDDEVNRCPNEANLTAYVPTWTLAQARFPAMGDRQGVIDAGPTTPGDGYARHTFAALSVSVPQDDAGSGRDAPSGTTNAVPIAMDTPYDGLLVPGVDASDTYVLQATPGTRVRVEVDRPGTCPSLWDSGSADLSNGCTTNGRATWADATVPADGRLYANFGLSYVHYSFVVREAPD